MDSLGSGMEAVENKLILLYFIYKAAIPVSSLQIIKIFMANRFMNYFFLQQSINDLTGLGLLNTAERDGKTFYTIAEKGKETLALLDEKIPLGIRNRIDSTISEIRRNIRNETLISADYFPESENEFVVKLGIHEDNFSLIDISLTVGSKKEAQEICNNWKHNSKHIYPEIINSLLKEYGQP